MLAAAGLATVTPGRALAQASSVLDAGAATGGIVDPNKPMLLQADELVYDNANSRVTAIGNVEIYYNNYALTAARVVYDQAANTLIADGNVRIREPDGAVISADHITLTDDFRDGFIQSLRVVTSDETRIAAASATRTNAQTTVFEDAVYTPCKPCGNDPDSPPLWRIRAGKITHKRDEGNLYYQDLFFDVLGTPVAWLPYFSSPDPSVKRRSGFLSPSYGSSDDLGMTAEIPYFWAIAPNMDLLLNPKLMSKEGLLFQGTFRHRIAAGVYKIEFAGINQNDEDEIGPLVGDPRDNEWRGSMATTGEFQLGSWWTAGWDATIESDDTFRRYYGLDSNIRTDRISEAHVVGMSERNYLGTYFYHFGGLLAADTSNAESRAHPSLDYHHIVAGSVLGGELSFDANALSLSRDQGADSNRVIAQASWRSQLIDGLGQVFSPFAFWRADGYGVSNVVDPLTGIPQTDSSITRTIGAIGLEYRYPFVAHTELAAHVIEPIVQIIARPDDVEQTTVPNEDAQSLVFDDALLFDIDKFSGYDRIETGVRANYGLQYTMQLYEGGSVRAVIGQSQHLSGENPFTGDSGLETDDSDYVAGLYFAPTSALSIISQSRFDNTGFDLKRQDVSLRAAYGPAAIALTYGFERSSDQVGEFRQDQELISSGSLQVTDNWAVLASLRYDLEEDFMISDSLGLKYSDECFALAVTYAETNITDRDVDPDQSIMVKFELKSLGGTSFDVDGIGDAAAKETGK